MDISRTLKIEKELTAPGSYFEVQNELILGETMPAFKNRYQSLRTMLEMSGGFGDKDYIVYEGRRITFANHLKAVCNTAHVMREKYGIGKGDRVAILGSNKPEWIVAFWATVSLGAIAVGLNGWWVTDEIMWSLGDCEPKLLVGDRRRLARIKDEKVLIPVIAMEDELDGFFSIESDLPLPEETVEGDDPACIFYTSGTTGRPKGALLSNQGITSSVITCQFMGLRYFQTSGIEPPAEPNIFCTNPLFHVSGLHMLAINALAAGVKTVWMEGRFDPEKALELIQSEKCTSWSPMFTIANRFINFAEEKSITVPEITNIGNGGAPMPVTLQNRIRKIFPNLNDSLNAGFGMTECNALATLNWYKELKEKPFSVGRPLPTVEIQIRDLVYGEPVEKNTDGEVFVRSPMVMIEYWRRPEATAETILPGRWLATGDIGKFDDDRHLIVNTRARDLILRGAENIYPVEIEHRLCEHSEVLEAAVVGVDSPEYGQEVKAYVYLRSGSNVEPSKLAEWVAEKLSPYKVPAHWEILDKPIPKNAVGKMLKTVLIENRDNPFIED